MLKIGALANLFAQKYKSLLLRKTKGICRVENVSYLTHRTTTGKFILPIENQKHCIAVDCDRRLIMESDPKFPAPLPLNLESFAKINVDKRDLSKLYRVIHQ